MDIYHMNEGNIVVYHGKRYKQNWIKRDRFSLEWSISALCSSLSNVKDVNVHALKHELPLMCTDITKI